LPEAAFTELADGGGSPATMRRLGDAQHSKHLMLLHAIAEAATGPEAGPAAFRAGYEQLARIQDAAPGAAAWLLGLPHLGGWVHDTLIHLDQGTAADFGHFACLVAAAAIRGGRPVDLDVPVRDGRVRLPGLGSLPVASEKAWVRLRSDGTRVTAGDESAEARLLVPDDGTGAAHLGIVRFWQAQQHAETDPDGLLRAQVLFARWRPAIGETVQTLLKTGSLTPAGVRFAERLRAQGQQLMSAPVPAEAARIADSADPQPDAWIGLALALHQLPPSPPRAALATRLAQVAEVHVRLGGRTDPLDLASWFT
jgi:hypothetical protein